MGISTRLGGPGRRSAATRAEATAGRERWGPGGGRGEETLIRCVHALCAAHAGGEKEAPAPFPENTASSCRFQGHAVGQRAQAPAFACCPGGSLFSRVKLFLWYNSAEK